MKKKIHITQIIRHIFQMAAFVLFPGLFITVFTAVRDIYTTVIRGSFHFSAYAGQLLVLAAVFLVTMLFGRFFCGYLCAFGAMGDLLWWASSKVIKKPVSIHAETDRSLKYLKYIILLSIVMFVWTLPAPIDSTYSPWNVFGVYSNLKGWTNGKALLSVGGLLLLLIMAGNFLIERFFCRYLCPLGAIFTIISRLRLHRIRKPTDGCGLCQLCTKKCSMGIPLKEMDAVQSGECIDCYRCVDACPRNNVTAAPAPMLAGTVAAVGISGICYAGTLAVPMPAAVPDSVATGEAADGQGAYQDGVYTGTGSGFRGDISVEVTVEGGVIVDITVISTEDDRQFFDRASSVISRIISAQSMDVDAVSGATFSSNGIIEAVADALNVPYSNPNNGSTQRGHGKKGVGGGG